MNQSSLDSPTLESLLESTGGDHEFVAELFATYLEEAPGLMAGIEAGETGGDFDGLRAAAHTLKSTSASLGALRLAAVCRELEEAGRTHSIPDPGLVAKARSFLEEVTSDMTEFIAETSAS